MILVVLTNNKVCESVRSCFMHFDAPEQMIYVFMDELNATIKTFTDTDVVVLLLFPNSACLGHKHQGLLYMFMS